MIFTIRRPALTSPTLYRAFRDLGTESSLSTYNIRLQSQWWQRGRYDWNVGHGITPLMVEAEDYTASPEFGQHLAKRAGLSPGSCVIEWEAPTVEEMSKMDQTYVKVQQTLLKPTGSVSGKIRRDVLVEEEIEKWREEFGVEEANSVIEIFTQPIGHYQYLVKLKLRLP